MLEIDLIILGILLVLSAFFSGVETAIVSVDRIKARQLVKEGNKSAKLIEEFQNNPHKMLSAILIGNNVVNIASTAIATNVAIQIFQSNAIGIAIGIMTFVILVFGEITPKSIAVQNSVAISLIAIRPIKLLSILLSPLIWLLGGVRGLLGRIIGVRENQRMTEQDIKTMVTMGAEAGAINKIEREMIHRIFSFNDIDVEQVMTPSIEMKTIPSGTKIKEIKKLFVETPFSRIPIYDEKKRKITGIFYVKDAWAYLKKKDENTLVEKIARPALFVPKTKKIDKLLSQFQQEYIHLAVVIDDYGGVLGIVTIEDLLEEIVGEIVDESDVELGIRKVGKDVFEASGKISLDEINQHVGTKWESKEFDTLSGFIIEKLDRLPKENEEIKVDKHTITPIKVREPKILRIRISKNVNK
ncbi:MAG: hemolysin [Candidatus Diapherotrites archaeon]|uniref:Hemolysin n=1 Tax=Candidatus Iainarchaeum sp. TaxID=3101447 RepID=A0A2D6LZT1_9ARCH|nr:hemolysin [Candidatus Diapherotrites archaeon]|tara:strand:+ start:4874 stop:6112 length:1239 start_codon:yes stop_codon:yes gene_type:complete